MSRANLPSMNRDRVDAFAELLSEDLRLCEIQARMKLTKGEVSSTMRRIRLELGAQAV